MRLSKGYSLLELLVVIAILGVVLTVSVPNLVKANQNYKLQAAAREVAQSLHAASLKSIGGNSAKTVIFDTAANQVHLNNGTVLALPAGIRFVALTDSAKAPVSIKSAVTHTSLAGQNTDAKQAVSFPTTAHSHQYAAVFTAKGLPDVQPGIVNWVYLTNENGEIFAVTLASTGETQVVKVNG